MTDRRFLPLCLLVLVVFGSLSVRASGPLWISTRSLTIPENGEVTEMVLRIPNHEFSFVPPTGWRVSVETNETKILWRHRDYNSTISFRILPSENARLAMVEPESLRQKALQNFPGAQVVEESVCYTGSGQGRAVDVQYVLDGKFQVASRVAAVSFSGGMIEFNLTSSPEKYPQLRHDLNLLLNSFRVHGGSSN